MNISQKTLFLFSSVILMFFSMFFVPEILFAAPETTGDTNIYLREPLLPGEDFVIGDRNDGSINILADYISMIYRYVAALGGIIAVLVVMFAGFQIMTSGGSTEARGEAKTMIIKTLMGVAMLFLSGLFLYAINPNFYVFG